MAKIPTLNPKNFSMVFQSEGHVEEEEPERNFRMRSSANMQIKYAPSYNHHIRDSSESGVSYEDDSPIPI